MRHLKILTISAISALALSAALGAGTASASALKQIGGGTLGVGTSIEGTLEAKNSLFLEDAFGFTIATCLGATFSGSIERVTPTGHPKGKLGTLDFTNCAHTFDPDAKGELEIRNIAGTTNGTVFSNGMKILFFNTLLNQNCLANTGAGTDIGTLTAATSATGRATIDINGLLPLEGCSASNARWTGKFEVTKPIGLIVESS